MANKEQLEILRQGVQEWNAWRREHPEILPDLTGASLDGARLDHVRFDDARLDGARLDDASLTAANFNRASLDGASLTAAHLGGASLGSASLVGAYLADATLLCARLHGVRLDDARLDGASLGLTSVLAVDLSLSEGLASVKHHFASGIATSTLELTAAGLAKDASRQATIETFYRGAGVEEDVIEFYRSRIGRPIQYFSSFISYSHADQSFVRRLYDGLQGRRIRCWLDVHDMKVGERILDSVNEAVRLHDKLLVCCSLASLTSSWVEDELAAAIERERKEDRLLLIPLDLDGYLFDGYEGRFGPRLRERLVADFTGWATENAKFEAGFKRVVEALRTGETAPPTPKL